MPSVRKGGRQGPYRSIVEVLSWPMSNDLYLSVHCRHRGNVQKAKNHPVQPTPKIKIDVVFSTAFLPSTRQLFCVLLLTHRNLPRPKKGLCLQHTLSTIGIGGRTGPTPPRVLPPSVFSTSFAKAPKQCCNAAAAGGHKFFARVLPHLYRPTMQSYHSSVMATSGTAQYDLMYYLKGAAAGGICCSITHGALTPVDVVKTRVQLDPVKVGAAMLALACALARWLLRDGFSVRKTFVRAIRQPFEWQC